MKKWVVIVICIAVVLCFVGTVTGVSLAIWQETKNKDVGIGVTPEINPSLRFQIFAPIDAANHLMTFDEYDVSVHGSAGYSTTTDKGYSLFVHGSDGYQPASSQQIDSGTTLYVRDGTVAYDETNAEHGIRLYQTITAAGIDLYIKQIEQTEEGEVVSYVLATTIPVAGTPALFVRNPNYDAGDATSQVYIPHDPAVHGRLLAKNTTSTNFVLMYYEGDNLVVANTEHVVAADGLYVYNYEEYTASNASIYGNLYTDNKTLKGFYLYVRSGNDYVLANPEQITAGTGLMASGAIHSYALVGYTGVVAEVVVPSTYTNALGKEYAVTRICSSNDFADDAFMGNPVITSLVIPDSVKSIADGTFANMSALNTIYFNGNGEIRLGKYCFMACSKLKTVHTDGVSLVDTSNNAVAISGTNEVFLGCDLLTE